MNKATHNGTCQACGREQAFNGSMAKHGYTTESGYFSGTCSGSDRPALELETSHNVDVVAAVRKWADDQDKKANGEITSIVISVRDYDATSRFAHKDIRVTLVEYIAARNHSSNDEFDDLYTREFNQKVESVRYNLRRAATFARKDADNLETLRDTTYGNDLPEREIEATLHREDFTKSPRGAYERQAELKEQGIKATVRRNRYNEITLTYRA